MSSILDRKVVNISLSLGSILTTIDGLGIPLIAGAATFSGEYVKSYTPESDYSDATDLTSGLIAGLDAVFGHSVYKPSTCKVGKVQTDQKLDINLAINSVSENDVFGITIEGNIYTYTAGALDAEADVVDALITLITAGAEPVALTDNGNDFDIEATEAGTPFTYATPATVTGDQDITVTTANRSIKTELDEIQAEDPGWYFLVLESRTQLDIDRASEWVSEQTEPKLLIAQSSDSDIPDASVSTDQASDLKATGTSRTALFYKPQDSERFDCGIVGKAGSKDPETGATTWAHKEIDGMTVDYLDADQQLAITGKNCNFYSSFAGGGGTFDGRLVSGDVGDLAYIDERISADWFLLKVQTQLLALQKRYSDTLNSKIPMTDAGFTIFENKIRDIFSQGVRVGHFEAGTGYVIVPSRDPNSDNPLSDADKISRNVPIVCGVTLSGAAHTIEITAYITQA